MEAVIGDLKAAAVLGSCLSRDYADGMFRLLATYRSLSASEAASRLDLHVQTAQDFLEALAGLGVLGREEASDGKRPYIRYSLREPRLRLDIDLAAAFVEPAGGEAAWGRIRERKNSGARFATGRDGASIRSVVTWSGEGRAGRERRLGLTGAQGRFLFHLPFPTAEPLPVGEIMRRAGVEEAAAAEIRDLLVWLDAHGIVERLGP